MQSTDSSSSQDSLSPIHRVLVTGGLGNIGQHTIRALLKQRRSVWCLDLDTSEHRRAAAALQAWYRKRRRSAGDSALHFIWTDIRDKSLLRQLVAQVKPEAVIHLAYIIPPAVDQNPAQAAAVNIEGTASLLAVMTEQTPRARFIFASSVMVYGKQTCQPPPRRADEPLQPVELYGQQKVACEQMIITSQLPWTILRLGAAPPIAIGAIDPIMFEVPLDTRIEFVHPADVGQAFANTLDCPEAVGRILLIGGGQACQLYQRDFINRALQNLGIGTLPETAFGKRPFHIDWLDTAESQRLLKYQRHTYDDYLREIKSRMGLLQPLISSLRPLIRSAVLRQSRYHRRNPNLVGKVAVVTGASSGIGEAVARRLAYEGLKVALVARRQERLQRIAQELAQDGAETLPIAADIAQEAERLRVRETIRQHYGEIDILVNNAGLGWYGYGCRMPWEMAAQILKVNTEALVHLTLSYLPEMTRRGSGYIINIGSIAGSLPEQGVAVYSATKAFADAFTTALHRELRGTGVHLSIIRAGPVATEFFSRAKECPSGMPVPAERFAVSAERVADRVWSLLNHPRRVSYVPRILWFSRWVEPYFDWIIDRLGPLLLKRAERIT